MPRRSDVQDMFTLTPLQQGMLSYAIAGLHAFQERSVVSLSGPLNVEAFAAAWRALVDRHAALRTAFAWKALRVPHQIVLARVPLQMRLVDATTLDAAAQERLLTRLCAGSAGLALDRAPLMSLVLVRVASRRWHLVWTISHLVTDAFSFSILMEDLLQCYRLSLAGRPWDARRGPSFRDYVGWLKRRDLAPAIDLWERTLASRRAGGQRPKPIAVEAAGAATRGLTLPAALTQELQRTAVRQGTSLFVLYLGTFAIVQRLLTGAAAPVIAIVTSCRALPIARLEAMVGLVMNSVPVPIEVPELETLDGWLAGLGAALEPFLRCEFAPFHRLQEICAAHGQRADVAFNYLNVNRRPARGPGFEVTGFREVLRSSFSLGVDVTPGHETRLEVSYAPSLYSSAMVDRALAQWRDVLEMTPEGGRPVGAIVREMTRAAAGARAQDVETRRRVSLPAWIQ